MRFNRQNKLQGSRPKTSPSGRYAPDEGSVRKGKIDVCRTVLVVVRKSFSNATEATTTGTAKVTTNNYYYYYY